VKGVSPSARELKHNATQKRPVSEAPVTVQTLGTRRVLSPVVPLTHPILKNNPEVLIAVQVVSLVAKQAKPVEDVSPND
jgi:hypothetical protein